MTGFDPTAPKYRYFVTDILSNSLIAEIPFSGVSYERSLKSAGKFSGSIPVLDSTAAMNLYDNTLPGRTALYVVRNDECVWGGIIWSRSYDVVGKTLSVQGSEFTSYLHHRNIWRTFSHDFGATAVKGVITDPVVFYLNSGTYHFTAGSAVKIEFYETENFTYNGYYDVLAYAISDTSFAVSIPTLPVGTYTSVTVKVRVDTYDYTRQLLSEMQIDFSDINFPNGEIEPGIQTDYDVNSRVLTNGVVTLTTATAHDAIIGQTVDVRNISAYRTNLCTNPSFEAVGTTGWFGVNGTIARAAGTITNGSGSWSTQVTHTTTGGGGAAFGLFTVAPSTVYTATIQCLRLSGSRTYRIAFDWYNGASYVSTSAGTSQTCLTSTRLTVTATAPATANQAYITVYGSGGGVVGNWFQIDAALIEQSSTAGSYFDGSTSDLAAWTGTVDNSTSTLVVDLNGSHEIVATTSTTISYAVDDVDIASAATTALVYNIIKKELDAATGLVTLTTDGNHSLSIGQYVDITNVDDVAATYALFDGTHKIVTTPTSATFTYYVYSPSNEIYEATITSIFRPKIENIGVAFEAFWYYTDSVVPFKAGDTVTVSGVDPVAYNITGAVYYVDPETKKMFTILNAGSPTAYVSGGEVSGYITVNAENALAAGDKVAISGVTPISYNSSEATIVSATASNFVLQSANVEAYETGGNVNLVVPISGEARMEAKLSLNTYGPFPGNADVGIEFSTTDYSGVNIANNTYRGYELRSIGEELDQYSDTVDGFEYRVDCAYDPTTLSFTRTFVLLPINFPDPPAPGAISPLSRFGADRYVFEYPGNVNNVTVEESAENAATRFFVVGNISDLGGDASQPYAVASATDLIAGGWPILDGAATRQDAYLENQLYDYAKRYLSEFRPPVTDIKISVNGSLDPVIGSYSPGDWCAVIIYDPFVQMRMSSDLEIRDDILVRKIENISVRVPDGVAFPEEVELLLFAEWEVDKVGE